ncbi:MAG: phosphotransferase family protein [Parvibaculales bacterium]|mgnify:FL=1
MTDFPDHPEKFTNAWLAEKLGFPEAALKGFDFTPVGTGQVGDSYRLRLDWHEGDGPATIVAKCSAADPTSRETARNMNLYEIEANWYGDYAANVGVRTPYAYYVGLDTADIGNFMLLMEDLAPAQQISQMDGCDAQTVALALNEAALLHRAAWNDPQLPETAWLNYSKGRKEFIGQLLVAVYPEWCARYEGRIEKNILEMGQSLVERYDQYTREIAGPIVLSHGDFRLDNMLFHDANGRAVILDWQTLSAGPPMPDVAYCVSTSFADPAARATHEKALVTGYYEKLALPDSDYDFDTAWRDYRRYAFSGFLMGVLSAMLVERTERGDEMFAVMAERSGYQALHLDSLALV